jgi:hypothetical protein
MTAGVFARKRGTRPCSRTLMGRRQIINDTSAAACTVYIVIVVVGARHELFIHRGQRRGAKCLLMNLVARPAAIINVCTCSERELLHFDPHPQHHLASRAWSSPLYGGWMGERVTACAAAAKRRRDRRLSAACSCFLTEHCRIWKSSLHHV